MEKSFLLSKTVWFNILAFVAVTFGVEELTSVELQEDLIVGVFAIGNVVLRFLTKQPLKLGA